MVALVSKEDQKKVLTQKSIECYESILGDTTNSTFGCPPVWDGILCWPPTANGTTVSQVCPNYIYGFNQAESATRACNPDGHWWVNPDLNTTWTNLTLCLTGDMPNEQYQVSDIFLGHVDKIRVMYNIGYGISLVSLVLAVSIMLYFKRLHCPRNMVHINLFLSFIFRAIISFVKENALVNGVGFPFDVDQPEEGLVLFKENGSHWQCRMLFTFFNYILGANYMWIFAEGIYLHMLITFTTFSEKSGVKKLILFGWGTPVLFVVPWVAVRATLENVLCWNTHPTPEYFWLIRGPIVAALGINFIIFLNIIRVLFTKLNAFNTQDAKRKLAKSTLVLIPLFGVHYIVFIGLPNKVDETTEIIKLYYEMFFNSFQGFLVSLLFCFLNGEVQGEFRKRWKRFRLKHGGSSFSRRYTRDTMTSFVSRPRDSIISSQELSNGKVSKKTDKNSNSPAMPVSVIQNGHVKFENCNETDPMIEMITVDTHVNGDGQHNSGDTTLR